VVICKLCNSYVVQAMIEVHNRDVHANMDRLVCPDCGKLFTSKRSLAVKDGSIVEEKCLQCLLEEDCVMAKEVWA